MDKTENIVALGDSGNYDTDCIFIVYFVDILVPDEYFAVYAVNALYTSVYLRRLCKFLGLESLSDTALDYLDEGFTLFLFVFENALDLGISIGICLNVLKWSKDNL